MIDEKNCKNISAQIVETEKDISAQDVADVIRYLYEHSKTFREMVDEISRLDGKVVVSVDDTYISPRTPTSTDPEGDGDGIAGNLDDASTTQNPSNGVDARINVPTGAYDGDSFATGPTTNGEQSLAGVIIHEMAHALNDVKQNKGSSNTLSGEEEEKYAEKIEAQIRDELKMQRIDTVLNGGMDAHEYTDPVNTAPRLMEFGPPPSIPEGECIVPTKDKSGLPDWMEGLIQQFIAAITRGSPLVLDLDHSGSINLISLENSNAYFDRDQDGFAESSGIVAKEDGYLAIDLNQNGKIDDNGELFGTVDNGRPVPRSERRGGPFHARHDFRFCGHRPAFPAL